MYLATNSCNDYSTFHFSVTNITIELNNLRE